MSNSKKTPISPKWDMYLFANGKKAQISCRIGRASNMWEIPGRTARVIALLQQAYDEDQRLPIDLRGFRQADEIAKWYDENRAVEPPLRSTITAYLYQLCFILKKPAVTGEVFPPLIARVKNSGARLLYPVEIHQLGSLIDTDHDLRPNHRANARPGVPNVRADARRPAASRRRRSAADSA